MAIAVPLLLANTAAGAAIAGAVGLSTTALAVATSVVFQVTGVNDKINKAASKVFGEDLVKIANIAGAVYGAYNGGFSLDPAKEFLGIGEAAAGGAEAATAMNVPTGAEAGAAFEAQMAGNGLSPVSISDTTASSVFERLDTFEGPPRIENMDKGFSLNTGKESGIDTSPRGERVTGGATSTPATPSTSGIEQQRTPLASNANATASNAAGTQATAAQSGVDKLLGVNRSTPNATASNATAAPQSVFDKVFSKVGDKTIAGLIQGAAAGYGNAQQARLAEERSRVNPTTIRGYTYRPTV